MATATTATLRATLNYPPITIEPPLQHTGPKYIISDLQTSCVGSLGHEHISQSGGL